MGFPRRELLQEAGSRRPNSSVTPDPPAMTHRFGDQRAPAPALKCCPRLPNRNADEMSIAFEQEKNKRRSDTSISAECLHLLDREPCGRRPPPHKQVRYGSGWLVPHPAPPIARSHANTDRRLSNCVPRCQLRTLRRSPTLSGTASPAQLAR